MSAHVERAEVDVITERSRYYVGLAVAASGRDSAESLACEVFGLRGGQFDHVCGNAWTTVRLPWATAGGKAPDRRSVGRSLDEAGVMGRRRGARHEQHVGVRADQSAARRRVRQSLGGVDLLIRANLRSASLMTDVPVLLQPLAASHDMLLETHKRDGTWVPTPV